ncbi:hypothetical protein D3C78_589050 [compost metagenome]
MHALAFTNKNNGTRRIILLEQMLQQLKLVFKVICAVIPLVDLFALTRRRCGRNFGRILKKTLGKVFNRVAFKRCGEEHRLFAPARFARDMLDVLRKT